MFQRHHAFKETRVDILVVTGQPRVGFVERIFRQQRDAVEGLLAVGDDVVAELLDGFARKRLIDALDLLQADDVGRAVLAARSAGARAAVGSS